MKAPKKRNLIILLLAIGLLSAACATQKGPNCLKGGQHYCQTRGVFTHEWYDYYERGLSCMEGGCYPLALADFDRAIAARPDDQRMAKTYGMHLRDYFPHREKGLIYYLTGQYEAAQRELERSLSYQKSDKAFYYLDAVRRKLLQKQGKPISVPRIKLNVPQGDKAIRTRADPLIIAGIAQDPQYVSELSIQGRPMFMQGSRQKFAFEQSLSLAPGAHAVEIQAKNLRGGTREKRLLVHVDRAGPLILLSEIDETKGISGIIRDPAWPVTLTVNGKPWSIASSESARFSLPSAAFAHGDLQLVATDRLGNLTQAQISPAMFETQTLSLLAENMAFPVADDSRSQAPLLAAKTPGPRIRLLKLPASNTVYSRFFSLKGRILSRYPLQSVRLNGKALAIKKGRMAFFNRSVRLKKGSNLISIWAKDIRGQTRLKEIRLRRKQPEVFKLKYRCMLKAAPFEADSPQDLHQPQIFQTPFQSLFLQGLLSQKRFQIRLQKAFAEKFRDIRVQGAEKITKGASRPDTRRLMLTGYLYQTREGIEAVAKVMDTETSEVCDVLDAYGEFQSDFQIQQLSDKLLKKFGQAFPLFKGRILQKQGTRAFVNMDARPGRMDWPLRVGSGEKFMGDARIDQIQAQGCWLRCVNGRCGKSSPGDWVVSQ